MEDCEKTNEQLVEELDMLRQEVDRLKLQEVAYEAQTELLRTLVSMGDVPSPTLALRSLAQQSLRICNRLTGAEEGSLFFTDEDGRVSECVLARGATIKEHKDDLIGQVLEKGLAGWVYEKHQVGLITDTMRDERWLQLPNEPYTVRSALCIPILRGKRLLGLITLMHPQPGHFRYEAARLMQTTTMQIGLVVELLRRYTIARDEQQHIPEESAAVATIVPPTITTIDPDYPPTSTLPHSTTTSATDLISTALEPTTTLPKTTLKPNDPAIAAKADNYANYTDRSPNLPSPEVQELQEHQEDPVTHPSEDLDADPFSTRSSSRSTSPTSSLPLPAVPTTLRPRSPQRTPPPPPSSLPRSPDPNSPVLRENALSRLGLYIVVWDGKFIYANNHLARIFGYRFNEIISLSTIFALVSESHYDFVAEKIYQCVRGQIKHLSCRFKGKCKDGRQINVEIYGVRTQFYGKSVMIGVLRDLPKPVPIMPESLKSS
jgi:PAS domain S-box-containing protein